MTRKRMITPSIWEDPEFNALTVKARLAFIGLISNADDDGYLRGDYRSLRRLIFGFDDPDDEEWLAELKKFTSLHFYEKRSESFVHLRNWEKYQNQRSERRQPTAYPVCDKCQTSVRQVPAEVSSVSKEVSSINISLKENYNKLLATKNKVGKKV